MIQKKCTNFSNCGNYVKPWQRYCPECDAKLERGYRLIERLLLSKDQEQPKKSGAK